MNRLSAGFRCLLERFWMELLVLAVYTVLTFVLFYPFSILHMGNQLIGNTADSYQGLWDLWWMRHSTLSLSNPYITSFIYYPYGANLYAHTLSPAAGLLTIPFQLAGGVVFSFNLIILASFVLGGYGAYRLAKHITHDKLASFFAGAAFSFSTYHFAKSLGDMNLATIQWIPFYILFLIKMRQEKSLKNIGAALVFLALTAFMADLQYVLFIAIFTIIYVLYELAFNRQQILGFLKRFTIMIAAFSAIIVAVFEPLIVGWFTGQYSYAKSTAAFSAATSGDLLGFFTPSQFNPIFAPAVHGINQTFTTTIAYPLEGNTYLGYVVLALTVYAIIKVRKEIKFWLLTAAVFAVLALGPVLHVLGAIPNNIPMPEAIIFYLVPIFRAPSRLIVITTLSLAIIAAIAIRHANVRIGKLKNGKILCLLFIVLLTGAMLAENNFLPYSTAQDTSVPKFYYQLAKMPGTFAVLDLPQNYSATNIYMYYATVSEKPVLVGSISHGSPQEILLREAVPLITQTGFAMDGKNPMEQTDIVTQPYNVTNIYALQYFNVKYVILHKDQMTTYAYNEMASYLDMLLGAPCYDDKTITAYQVPQATGGIFAFVADGWWAVENMGGWATRWIQNNGTIQIISPQNQFCSFNFTIGTEYTNKTVSVNLNGQPLGMYRAIVSQPRQIPLAILLKKGVNELTFNSPQTYVPNKVDSNSTDNRALSVYVKNVQIG
jgi:hypothetical protein